MAAATGDSVYGPGIYDMKAGGHMAYCAYRHLVRLGRTTKLPITFLFVPEEEIGSPTSREIIEREASAPKYALVCEPARDGGKIVLARKGTVIMKCAPKAARRMPACATRTAAAPSRRWRTRSWRSRR